MGLHQAFPLRPSCQHGTRVLGTYGGHVRDRCRKVLTVVGHTPVDNTGRRRAISITGSTPQTNTLRNRVRETFSVEDAKAAMGIDWMTMAGLSQAIPPAYSRFIGEQFKASQGFREGS
jgi:DNA (cytosine-5)-methyltransferase 1